MKTKFLLTSVIVIGLFNKTFSQWNSNTAVNTPIVTSANSQKNISISSDKKGGAIITWQDFRNGTNHDIYAQRINSLGFNKWAGNGVAICTATNEQASIVTTEDGNGGIIVAWEDYRNGLSDIYAQKIDSNGVVQWTANGVAVCSLPLSQQNVRIINDNAGGAIFVWQDSTSTVGVDIYAQRVSNTGAIMWASGGVPVCTAVLKQRRPRIQADNNGGAFIVWEDRRNGTDYNIYAQRINSLGTTLWATDGIIVCNAVNTQSSPKVRGDGAMGMIVVWEDERNALDDDIYAQRIGPGGNIKWANNGVVVCNATDNQEEVDITRDNVPNGIIVCWTDRRSLISGNSDIYIQKIDSLGAPLWQANGIALSGSLYSEKNPNVVGDGGGGAIVVWQDSIAATNWDIKAQRVSTAGALMWALNGATVCNAANVQNKPGSVSTTTGSCIFAWEDKRNGTDDNIYAQSLPFTTVGSIENLVSASGFNLFPNPFNASAQLLFKGSKGFDFNKGVLKFTNSAGALISLPYTPTPFGYELNRGALEPGIYFYTLVLEDSYFTGKIVVGDR